jgi:hypothetical protein
MKTYAVRFAFKHPATADFLAVVREVAGEDAAASVTGVLGTAGSVDYAVTSVSTREIGTPAGFTGEGSERKFAAARQAGSGTFESTVVVQRFGEAAWPVEVVFTFQDGSTLTRPWSGAERWVRWRLRGPKLVSAEVDAEHKCLLDGNTLNNGLRTEPDPRASRAWTARLMFWAQNLLEAFSLLGFAAAP